MIKNIRYLFDLGVEFVMGDDDIVVTGRDFYGEREDKYIETVYVFDNEVTLDYIYKSIKSRKEQENDR